MWRFAPKSCGVSETGQNLSRLTWANMTGQHPTTLEGPEIQHFRAFLVLGWARRGAVYDSETPGRIAGSRGAGVLRDGQEAQRRSVEADPAPPAHVEGSRTADALAFTWLASLWGIVALLGIAGAVALALCSATRRLRPSAVSDALAGIAAAAAVTGLAVWQREWVLLSHPSCSGCPTTSRYEPGCG